MYDKNSGTAVSKTDGEEKQVGHHICNAWPPKHTESWTLTFSEMESWTLTFGKKKQVGVKMLDVEDCKLRWCIIVITSATLQLPKQMESWTLTFRKKNPVGV